MRVIVLGARSDTNNIGSAIADRLDTRSVVMTDDCHVGHGVYVPPAIDLSQFDACVISLGVTIIKPFRLQSNADIANVLSGCLELPLICAKNYVRARGSRGGTIVFIGGYAASHPLTHSTTYCAAKAGLDMACRSLAWELMPEFRVYIIHPYHVSGTPMSAQVRETLIERFGSEDVADDYARKDLKMPEHLTPDEVAQMVDFLLINPVAPWLAGSGLNMFGGTR